MIIATHTTPAVPLGVVQARPPSHPARSHNQPGVSLCSARTVDVLPSADTSEHAVWEKGESAKPHPERIDEGHLRLLIMMGAKSPLWGRGRLMAVILDHRRRWQEVQIAGRTTSCCAEAVIALLHHRQTTNAARRRMTSLRVCKALARGPCAERKRVDRCAFTLIKVPSPPKQRRCWIIFDFCRGARAASRRLRMLLLCQTCTD